MGELLSNNPPGFHRKNSGQIEQNPLPDGITKKQSHYAQQLSKNPEIVEEVKQQAREKGDFGNVSDTDQAILRACPFYNQCLLLF